MKAFIKVLLVPVGFLLCFIGVILPWKVRNAYLKAFVGPICNIALNSNTFIDFFMEVGFATDYSVSKTICKNRRE